MKKEDYQEIIFNQLELLNLPQIQRRFIAYKLADLGETEIIKAQLIGNTLSIECEANKYKTELLPIDIPANTIVKIL
jgi:hypothetical protein